MLLSMNSNNAGAWFSRPVQLSARKRVMAALQNEFVGRVKMRRIDIYPNWNVYSKYMRQYGCVIEAEPSNVLGYVRSLAFISPLGDVTVVPSGGVELIVDRLMHFISFRLL